MPSSRLALVAATMLLSMGFVVVPHSPASAAKFCAQLRGSTAPGTPGLLVFDARGMPGARKTPGRRALLQIAPLGTHGDKAKPLAAYRRSASFL